MLSRKDVYQILANKFVCLRLDWEQGNHFKNRFGFILGTGDQMILTPQGEIIKPSPALARGKDTVLYGRNGCDTTGEVLGQVVQRHTQNGQTNALSMDWFFWPRHESRRPGGVYPVSPESMAGFARLPIAKVQGALPSALKDPDFLRRHVRQFIWVRGSQNAESSILIRRVKDGLPEGKPLILDQIKPGTMDRKTLSESLDRAWMSYMKDRPLVARGYLENPHGNWMRSIRQTMIYEDEEVRRRAQAGVLVPPGRH